MRPAPAPAPAPFTLTYHPPHQLTCAASPRSIHPLHSPCPITRLPQLTCAASPRKKTSRTLLASSPSRWWLPPAAKWCRAEAGADAATAPVAAARCRRREGPPVPAVAAVGGGLVAAPVQGRPPQQRLRRCRRQKLRSLKRQPSSILYKCGGSVGDQWYGCTRYDPESNEQLGCTCTERRTSGAQLEVPYSPQDLPARITPPLPLPHPEMPCSSCSEAAALFEALSILLREAWLCPQAAETRAYCNTSVEG